MAKLEGGEMEDELSPRFLEYLSLSYYFPPFLF